MPGHILDEREIQQLKSSYMSDNTAFMKWGTEIEAKENVIDSAFLKRNNISIIGLDKFLPLANFVEPGQKQLHKLKMLIIDLEIEAGLKNAAEQTALSIIDDIELSRGDRGFYQRALITQRHELEEHHDSEVEKKVGFFNKIFAKKQPEQQGVPPQ